MLSARRFIFSRSFLVITTLAVAAAFLCTAPGDAFAQGKGKKAEPKKTEQKKTETPAKEEKKAEPAPEAR